MAYKNLIEFFLKRNSKKKLLIIEEPYELKKIISEREDYEPFNQIYLVSFFQLAAEVAKSDSPVNNKEIEYFVSIFNENDQRKFHIKKLFCEACACKNDFLIASTKIESLFSENHKLRLDTFDTLLEMALIDGYLKTQETSILENIFDNLCLGNFGEYLKKSLSEKLTKKNYFEESGEHNHQLDKKYKELIKTYHPDKFYLLDSIDQNYLSLIEERFKTINVEYQLLKKNRK